MEEELEFLESEAIFQENVLKEEGIIFPAGNFKSQNSRSKKPRRMKKGNSFPSVSRKCLRESVDSGRGNRFLRRRRGGTVRPASCDSGSPDFRRENGVFGVYRKRRTLKGRDLSQVRNAILRMTGFLET
ncbi:hypothetical protein C3L33_06122, partial [Rhododendron williamsianum]